MGIPPRAPRIGPVLVQRDLDLCLGPRSRHPPADLYLLGDHLGHLARLRRDRGTVLLRAPALTRNRLTFHLTDRPLWRNTPSVPPIRGTTKTKKTNIANEEREGYIYII